MRLGYVFSTLALALVAIALAGSARAAITTPVEGLVVSDDVLIVEDRGAQGTCGTYSTDTRIEVLRNGTVVAAWQKGASGPLSAVWSTYGRFADGPYTIRSLRMDPIFGWPCWPTGFREISRVNVTLRNPDPMYTRLELSGDTSGTWLERATIAAKLTVAETKAPIAGRLVVLVIGSNSVAGTTGADGVARATIPLHASPGRVTASAFFPGHEWRLPTMTTSTFDVLPRATYLTVSAPASGYWLESATVEARLYDAKLHTPVAYHPVAIRVGASAATAPTGSSGLAVAAIPVTDLPGIVPVNATFEGSRWYTASASASQFQVIARPTRVEYVGAEEGVRGANATFAARVTDATPGSAREGWPVEGARVAFGLWDADLEAASNASGIASAEALVLASYGEHALRVAFGGMPGRVAAEASFGFEVTWEFVFEDEAGAGALNLNTLTREFELVLPGHAIPIRSFDDATGAWAEAALDASPPLDALAGRRAVLAHADDSLRIVAGFDLPTNRFATTAIVEDTVYVLRSRGDPIEAPPIALPAPAALAAGGLA